MPFPGQDDPERPTDWRKARRLLTDLLSRGHKSEPELESARRKIAWLESQNRELRARVSSLEKSGTRSKGFQEPWTVHNVGTEPLLFTPPPLSSDQQQLVDRFHSFMYELPAQNGTRTYFVSWLGYGMFKWPTDLWSYQQILVETKPDVIIETGTHRGGSALFLATVCDLLGHGQVISVDIDDTFRSMFPLHPRITYLTGSSVAPAIIDEITALVAARTNIVVLLDSDHIRDHVLDELRIYGKFVPAGGHLIVEDTNVNGHPAYSEFGPGPWEAVQLFLAENSDFYADRSQERFYWTHNPSGFLRRRMR